MKIALSLFVIITGLLTVSCDRRTASEKLLCNAVGTGDTNFLQRYLDSGGDLNQAIRFTPDRNFSAPLLDIAIQSGQLDIMKFLLKNRANPNLRDSVGDTPLRWAIGRVRNGVPHEMEIRIFRSLLEAGADPNLGVSTEVGYTALLDSAFLSQSEMVSILLRTGLNVNATNRSGQSALHLAGNAETARLLIAAGANLTARTVTDQTPAESAAGFGRVDVFNVISNAIVQTNHTGNDVVP